MNLIPAVSTLDYMFDEFNKKFFSSSLEKPMIIIQTAGKGKRLPAGWFTLQKVWNKGEEEHYHEINISAEYLHRSIEETASTLIHEMVHLYNFVAEIKDTSNNFVYHNKKYKTEAEKHGLIVEHMEIYGWASTSLNFEAVEFLKTLNIDDSVFKCFREIQRKPKKKLEKWYTFVCQCDEKIKSKNETLEAVCSVCGSEFIRKEK